MSASQMLNLYVQKARAAGVQVEIFPFDDLSGRLAQILTDHSGTTNNPRLCPTAAPACATTRLAALPASGWPEDLLKVVESALGASGFEIVSPRQTAEGYAWDRSRLALARIGITFCPAFLAETGSMALPAGPGAGTLAALLPEVHIALSYPDGCRGSLADHLADTANALPSRLTLVTGPSRTGDIEATMTTGVHGPRMVIHCILTDRGGFGPE